MPLADDDYRLSMAVAARPKQPRPGDESLRSLLIHRLSDTTKLIWRRALRFDNMSAFCEPCQRWTIRIEEDHDEIDTRWHCPECNRRYRLEFAVFEEVDPEVTGEQAPEATPKLVNFEPEQLRADVGRWAREIDAWRTEGLTDEHPNIARRLARIRVANHLLARATGSRPSGGSDE